MNPRAPITGPGYRYVYFGLLAFLLLLAGCGRDRPAPMPPTRHVLLITVDTLRADYLSFNGYDRPTTPFLDQLARQSLYFTRAVTPIPRTTQALASTLTGCYPHTTKVRTLWDSLDAQMVSIAGLARRAGYRTVAVVSNHVLTPERKLDRGFDVYDAASDARDARATTQAVLSRLKGTNPSERLFLWVHYIDPHVPYFPPADYARQFDPNYAGRYPLHFGQEPGATGNVAYPEDLPKHRAVFENELPDELNRHVRRLYAAEIRRTDDAIAKLVNWLRESLGEDWTICFTADHAESLGEHDYFFDHGDYVYQATLAVPFLIHLPEGHPARRTGRCTDRVSLIDVMPTLAQLMGLSLPDSLPYKIEGRSLVPLLRGQTLPDRPTFAECGKSFFEPYVRRRVHFNVAGRFRSVTLADWKLIWTPGQTPEREFELYHLSDDPNETRDLYDPSHPQADRLKALLRDWLRSPTESSTPPSPADLQALRSLGYVASQDED